MKDNEIVKTLLTYQTPEYRKAYSDRTAWLMACLSELVYMRFEPLISDTFDSKRFIEELNNALSGEKSKKLVKLIGKLSYDHKNNLKELTSQLINLDLSLEETFSCDGTQAILVKSANMLVLVFRGTEPDRVNDIKADLNAIQEQCDTSGKVHRGFSNAFKAVESQIVETLSRDEYKDTPLYITGHSLGGAIATVATKRLNHSGGHAATYTFGSPRVGNEDWVAMIKTPVYRIVNAADMVPMLPPKGMTIDALAFSTRLLPMYGEKVSGWLERNFSGYMHGGNMRFLTNCKKGEYSDVKVLYSVHFWRRVKALLARLKPFGALASDHSMAVYRQKMFQIAKRRNL